MGSIVCGLMIPVVLFAARPDSLRLDSAQQALLDSLERMFNIQEVVVNIGGMHWRWTMAVEIGGEHWWWTLALGH